MADDVSYIHQLIKIEPCLEISNESTIKREQSNVIISLSESCPPTQEHSPVLESDPKSPEAPIPSESSSPIGSPMDSLYAKKRKLRVSTNTKVLNRVSTRDIICLPYENSDVISIPRCKNRDRLANTGMTGSIFIRRRWSPTNVVEEITSIFKDTFHIKDGCLFDFTFLGVSEINSKKLSRLKASSTMELGGPEILFACGQGSLYIMCDEKYGITPENLPVRPSANKPTTAVSSTDVNSTVTIPLSLSGNTSSAGSWNDGINTEISTSICSTSSTLQPAPSPALSKQDCLRDETMFTEIESDDTIAISEFVPTNVNPDTMKRSLLQWRRAQCTSGDKRNRVVVRRTHPREDTLRAFKSRELRPKSPINVAFVDNCGISTIGSARELFSTTIPHIRERYMYGQHGRMLPINKTAPVVDGTMVVFGKILAAAVLHGKQSLPFLNPVVAELLINQEKPMLCINWIHQNSMKSLIKKINQTTTEEEIQDLTDDTSVRDLMTDLGWEKALTLANKSTFVATACKHFLIFNQKAQLDALIEGMDFYGMKAYAQFYPDCIRNIIGYNSVSCKIDEGRIFEQFEIKYSEEGSKDREKESYTTVFLLKFLKNCSTDANSEVMSIEHFMQFFSGSRSIPLGGYDPKPVLEFSDSKLATASASNLHLTLPRTCTSFDVFNELLTSAIQKSYSFT